MARLNKKKIEERYLEYSTIIPTQFYLLCKLTEKKPEDVLYDFMCNTGMGGNGLGDVQRGKAMEYFISCGYGQHFYTEDDLRKIFREMDSMGSLFPRNDDERLITLHSSWLGQYREYWFQKWFLKVRRRQ